MGIAVKCPNGHQFKVKDKYAGKKGICPYCEGQVLVRVPDALSSKDFKTAVHRAAAKDRKAAATNSSSVLDDQTTSDDDSASGSLLGSSVIKHNVKCRCGESVPMWFAKCPKCGEYLPTR